MSSPTVTTLETFPKEVSVSKLQKLDADSASREAILKQIIRQFERKYQCSLEEFERKLDNRELPEHPCWEESIEWRNAVEQIENLQITRNIFEWMTNLLTQSKSSV